MLCRRSDEEGLNRSVARIVEDGGAASGFLLNAVAPDAIEERIAVVEADIGPIEVAVYNLGAQIGDRSLAETSHKVFELGWRLGTFGLFRLASAVCPLMEQRGRGTILVTSSTAAMRGNQGPALPCGRHGRAAHALPEPQCGVRPQGHPRGAHVIIDGMVDAPDTLGRMLGDEAFQRLRQERGLEHDGLLLPAEIADTYFQLARQHRSAWTHEIDLRAFSDTPWWNR